MVVAVLEGQLEGLMANLSMELASASENLLQEWFRQADALVGGRQLANDSIMRAEERLTVLLQAALGAATIEAASAGDLDDRLPLIEPEHLLAAKRGLCPGFWPFC